MRSVYAQTQDTDLAYPWQLPDCPCAGSSRLVSACQAWLAGRLCWAWKLLDTARLCPRGARRAGARSRSRPGHLPDAQELPGRPRDLEPHAAAAASDLPGTQHPAATSDGLAAPGG